jgi:MFS family permease
VGTVVALYAALPAVLALPAGRLIDRLGFKTPLLLGTGGVLVALMLPFALPSMPILYVTVCVLGVSFMFFQLASQTLAGAISDPSTRARNFSWVSLGFASANFTGPLLSGFLIDEIGHARTFGAIAVPLVPATLFALAASRWLPDVHTRSEKASGGALDLLRISDLRNTLIASGIVSAAWDLYQFFMPLYGHAQGLSATKIGMVMSAFAISIVLVRLVLPWGVKRTGEAQMLTYAMFVACAAYALFPLFQSAWPLAAISFLLGLGCGCGQPLSLTLVYNASPKGRVGEANGMRITVNQIVHFGIPLIFGALGSVAGLASVFLTNAAFLALGGYISQRSYVKGSPD